MPSYMGLFHLLQMLLCRPSLSTRISRFQDCEQLFFFMNLMSFLWEYSVCDVVNAVSQSDVLPVLAWLKNIFGLNPDPNDPMTNSWSKMVPCALGSVSLLPFTYCCSSSLVIWHTLNRLPFAPDPTLIMKPLLSFQHSLFYFTTFLGITTQSSTLMLYPVYNIYLFAKNWQSSMNCAVQSSVPHNRQKYILPLTNWKIPMNFCRWFHPWAIHFLSVSLTFGATTVLATRKKRGPFLCNPVYWRFR